jgi:hypothetical protein
MKLDLEQLKAQWTRTGEDTLAAVKREPLGLVAPVVVLLVSGLLDTFASRLGGWTTLPIALLEAAAWSFYWYLLPSSVGGSRKASAGLGWLVVPALSTVVVSLLVATNACVGVLGLFAVALLPLIEALVLFDGSWARGLREALQMMRTHWLLWGVTQVVLGLVVLLLGLLVTLLPSLALGVWSVFVSPFLVGPMVHLALVFRGTLFFALLDDTE